MTKEKEAPAPTPASVVLPSVNPVDPNKRIVIASGTRDLLTRSGHKYQLRVRNLMRALGKSL